MQKIVIIDDFISPRICDEYIQYYHMMWDRSVPKEGATYRYVDAGEDVPHDTFFSYVWNKQDEIANELANSRVQWAQIYEWPTGSHMGLHSDIASKHTVFTSILYLNDDFEGGFTEFADGSRVAPKKGRIVLYDGIHYMHRVPEITKGTRYTFATWYRKNI
jgi:hypothetical protein